VSVTGQYIVDAVLEMSRDASGALLTPAQGLNWVNDAQRCVALVRPDASSALTTFETGLDSLQTLAAGQIRLMGLTRNMGDDGATPGAAIRGPIPQEDMDSFLPGWHTATGAAVKQYCYNLETPKSFYVYPWVNSTWHVEGRFVVNPTALTDLADEIALDDIYSSAMIDWVAYRRYARDDETTPNWERAGRHFRNFFDVLGVKTRSDLAVDPRVLENQ
jgi:hypothetical protein